MAMPWKFAQEILILVFRIMIASFGLRILFLCALAVTGEDKTPFDGFGALYQFIPLPIFDEHTYVFGQWFGFFSTMTIVSYYVFTILKTLLVNHIEHEKPRPVGTSLFYRVLGKSHALGTAAGKSGEATKHLVKTHPTILTPIFVMEATLIAAPLYMSYSLILGMNGITDYFFPAFLQLVTGIHLYFLLATYNLVKIYMEPEVTRQFLSEMQAKTEKREMEMKMKKKNAAVCEGEKTKPAQDDKRDEKESMENFFKEPVPAKFKFNKNANLPVFPKDFKVPVVGSDAATTVKDKVDADKDGKKNNQVTIKCDKHVSYIHPSIMQNIVPACFPPFYHFPHPGAQQWGGNEINVNYPPPYDAKGAAEMK